MEQEGLSASESVARSVALKTPKHSEDQLVQEQVDYLRRQGSLQKAQQALLERELEGQALQNQGQAFVNQGQRIQNVRERLRIIFEVALALVVLIVVGIIGDLLVSAWHAQNVVLSAFDVPPAMDAQGQNGKVIATSLLDQLQKLQSETRASVAKRGVSDAWSGDVKLEIPEAHISIGELQRYLHDWLGNETHISGSIVQGADNSLVLTVRGNGFPARSFSGKADALPAVITQAAEYVYGAAETYRFGVYLETHGRDEEAIALDKAAYGSALPTDQPLLLNLWGNALANLGRYPESLDKYREAVALKPDYWIGYNNIMNVEAQLQDEEGLIQSGQQMERLARRGRWFSKGVNELYFGNLDQERWNLMTSHTAFVHDMAGSGGHGTSGVEEAPGDAQFLAQMHDRQAAELELQTSPGAGSDPYVIAATDFVHGLMALDRGDAAQALAPLGRTDAAATQSTELAGNFTGPSCWLALAEEWTGTPAAKVDADLARGGHLVDCYRFKADISDHRGDWALAQKQYAEAVALAPSIPSAYFSWGEALARHGDFDAAIAKFTEANLRGPHWADPLKSWGDALAAKQDYKGALVRYAKAEPYAPNWGALHLRWGQALDQLGRHDAAVEQYRKALGLDLTEAERKSLQGCCG